MAETTAEAESNILKPMETEGELCRELFHSYEQDKVDKL